jgi:hypothetical protein
MGLDVVTQEDRNFNTADLILDALNNNAFCYCNVIVQKKEFEKIP